MTSEKRFLLRMASIKCFLWVHFVTFTTIVYSKQSFCHKTNFLKEVRGNDSFNKSERILLPKLHISSVPNYLQILNDSTILIRKVGIEVRLDCWAPFPIDVEFNGHLSNREVKVNLVRRTATNYLDPTTFYFYINSTIQAYEETTGNYSCFAVRNKLVRSSYYLLYSPQPSECLLNRGQRLTIISKFEDRYLILPCPTSISNVTVYLYNMDTNQKIDLKLHNIVYDPKIGFTLPAVNEFLGNFQCRTELSVNDIVDIRIIPGKQSIFAPTQNIIVLREDEILRISCESTEQIIMQSEFTNPNSKIYQINNGVLTNSTISKYKYSLYYESKPGSLKKGDTGRISCYTNANEKLELIHEWSFSVRKGSSKNSTIFQGFNSYLCPNSVKLYECSNWVECNLRKCKHNDRTCKNYECNKINPFECVRSGILQCFNSQNESSQELIYFTGLDRNSTFTNWKLATLKDILRIKIIHFDSLKADTDVSTLGEAQEERLEVICEGSAFVVAAGFKYILRNRNGVEIQIPEDAIHHKWRNSVERDIIQSTLLLSITNNSTHLICKAPIWNSIEWIEDILDLDKERVRKTQEHLEKSKCSSSSSSGQKREKNVTRFFHDILVILILFKHGIS